MNLAECIVARVVCFLIGFVAGIIWQARQQGVHRRKLQAEIERLKQSTAALNEAVKNNQQPQPRS